MCFFVKLFHDFFDFVFPPSCPVCGKTVEIHGEFCDDCWPNYNWIDGPKCEHCGIPFLSDFEFDKSLLCPNCILKKKLPDLIRSACVYDDMSRAIMLPFKHGGKIHFGHAMARAMIWALRDVDIKPDIVIPVPLAYRRLVCRGYNQATILARPIARLYKAKLDVSSVHRKYRTDMGHKNARQRMENIRGVFTVVKPNKIRGKNILLVDDVMTTGVTFNELTRVLRRAGAGKIYAVTFCSVGYVA